MIPMYFEVCITSYFKVLRIIIHGTVSSRKGGVFQCPGINKSGYAATETSFFPYCSMVHDGKVRVDLCVHSCFNVSSR